MVKSKIPNTPKNHKSLRVVHITPEEMDNLHNTGQIDTQLKIYPNQPLVCKAGQKSALAMGILIRDSKKIKIKKIDTELSFEGIKGRNKEQQLLFALLNEMGIRVLVVTGSAGTGKAQPLDAKVLTKTGWQNMGDLQVGTQVATPDGSFAPISGIFPQGVKKIYRVTFSDNSATECCEEHLWLTQKEWEKHEGKAGSVRELKEIQASLQTARGRNNHFIPMTAAIDFPEKDLKLNPYLMGMLLGDGSFRNDNSPKISSADLFVVEKCRKLVEDMGGLLNHAGAYDYRMVSNTASQKAARYSLRATDVESGAVRNFKNTREAVSQGFSKAAVNMASRFGKVHAGMTWDRTECVELSTNPVKDALMSYGLMNLSSVDKFIPSDFLLGSKAQRIDLLQGLMDADGTVDYRSGQHVTFTTISKSLVQGMTQLVQSLGGIVSVQEKIPTFTYLGEKKTGQKCYNMSLNLPPEINPFSLPRKADAVVPKSKYVPSRSIVSVEYVGEKAAQCIMVDHPDHLYITDDYVVTHNTVCVGSHAFGTITRSKDMCLVLSKPLEIVTKTRFWGTVPGDENEKFGPFLKSYMILFESLGGKRAAGYIEKLVESKKIDFMPLELMRGVSLKHKYVWYDEAQNLDYHEMETLGSRIDDIGFSRLVLTGDLNQQDRDITAQDTGLHLLVSSPAFLNSPHTAHIDLIKNERGLVSQLFFDVFHPTAKAEEAPISEIVEADPEPSED